MIIHLSVNFQLRPSVFLQVVFAPTCPLFRSGMLLKEVVEGVRIRSKRGEIGNREVRFV
jgi:hypothetical protein